MELQEWIDGVFKETETDYTINDVIILYKSERECLPMGVKHLCDKLNPESVLEIGFVKGWTATQFQKHGIKHHTILEPNKIVYENALKWKGKYDTDIRILNMFSWDYSLDRDYDLVYDDRMIFKNIQEARHEKHLKDILPKRQWIASMASKCANKKISGYPIFYKIDDIHYVQPLEKFGEYKPCQQ